jgi:hypothetical protein
MLQDIMLCFWKVSEALGRGGGALVMKELGENGLG